MIFTIISILSLIGLLSYYIIFSRIKLSSFDIDNSAFNEPISIVICAKNELENLQKHASSWINQNYSDFEIIFVNDESTDGSYEFLTLLVAENDNIKLVDIDRSKEENIELLNLKGKRYALSKGVLAAKNDFLLLTDADCFANSEFWIGEMTNAFKDENIEIILGYSPYTKYKSILNLFIQLETLLTAFHYFGLANLGFPYMGVGRNLAYKKSVFNSDLIMKSNKSLSGDDDLIVQQFANKNNTAYNTRLNARTISIPENNIKNYLKQKRRHLGAGLHYTAKLKLVLNFFPVCLLLFTVSTILLFSTSLTLAILLMLIQFTSIFFLVKNSVFVKPYYY